LHYFYLLLPQNPVQLKVLNISIWEIIYINQIQNYYESAPGGAVYFLLSDGYIKVKKSLKTCFVYNNIFFFRIIKFQSD
jgi:hypothetical protein